MEINKYECKECGMCCKKAPCDIVPDDLPKILAKFEMGFKEFFKKYLIALPTVNSSKADCILRLVPVKKYFGKRIDKYFVDAEYMQEIREKGECIFLEDGKCTIHDVKPLGGRIMICPKMADGLSFQLTDDQYFVFWYNNQNIFYELSDEIEPILIKSRELYKTADSYFLKALNEGRNPNKDDMYLKYKGMADRLIGIELKNIINSIH